MKNTIITASDGNCGDFLVNHWMRSLKSNVDLKNIDVVVLDSCGSTFVPGRKTEIRIGKAGTGHGGGT